MSATESVQGFDREAVDGYFRAVAEERERLQWFIADARRRIERARATLDARLVLASMVFETCEEIAADRAPVSAPVAVAVAVADDGADGPGTPVPEAVDAAPIGWTAAVAS